MKMIIIYTINILVFFVNSFLQMFFFPYPPAQKGSASFHLFNPTPLIYQGEFIPFSPHPTRRGIKGTAL